MNMLLKFLLFAEEIGFEVKGKEKSKQRKNGSGILRTKLPSHELRVGRRGRGNSGMVLGRNFFPSSWRRNHKTYLCFGERADGTSPEIHRPTRAET